MVLYSSSRPVLLATGSWIPTASVVRYYTEIQALNDCCGSLLSCQATRRCSCWVCVDTQHSLDLRDLLLIDCTIECFDRILCRWALLALLLSLSYSLVWSSGQSLPAPTLLCYCLLLLIFAISLVASLLTIDCEQLATRRIDRFNSM